ncbi:class I SAM-dependent methyltransferase [soil metagenome]
MAGSFGRAVDAYDAARPGYPLEALEWLVPAAARTVLDLGAGTGKFTRLLVDSGRAVTAVEPSPEMLARLAETLPTVDARLGTAEAIPLGDHSVDAVVVAQAWHWVDPQVAGPEVARVLKPGGTLALVWNVMDGDVDWVRALGAAASGVERSVRPGNDVATKAVFSPEFDQVETAIFPWQFDVDRVGLVTLVSSWSEYLTAPETQQRRIREEVEAVFDAVSTTGAAGRIRIPYNTRCFRARLA